MRRSLFIIAVLALGLVIVPMSAYTEPVEFSDGGIHLAQVNTISCGLDFLPRRNHFEKFQCLARIMPIEARTLSAICQRSRLQLHR